MQVEQEKLNRELWREVSREDADCGRARDLLSRGADPKARDSMGLDALMRACSRWGGGGLAASLARLLIPVSDLAARDDRGWGAVVLAARACSDEALAELVAAGAAMAPDAEGLLPSAHARTPAARAIFEAAQLRQEVGRGEPASAEARRL